MNLKLNLSKKPVYILAISGGVDSMVLLDLFIKNNFKIVVVHFNHQVRDESILDHELIKDITTLHDVCYHYIKLSIKSGNFQAEARKERYNNLIKLSRKYNTNNIVTAHHLDDLAETILIKLIRGSNLLGYSSMRESTLINDINYLKPLLTYPKESLIKYANLNKIKYNLDESNLEDSYLRNRIRHNVMPFIKNERNSLDNFLSFSKQTYLASKYIRTKTLSFLNKKDEFSFSSFNKLDLTIKMDIIAYLLEKINSQRTYQKIETILKQLSSKKPNINITLSKDYKLVKSYDLIKLEPFINIDFQVSNYNLVISPKKIDKADEFIMICYNKLDFPLNIRTRKPGDKLQFNYGHKSLKKYLIEKKVPLNNRDQLLIVVDQSNTIIWIPNLYINNTLGNKNKLYLTIKEKNNAQ
ncbi:MAG: tRNA lysidine(34) synthetase TilS [Acholeplasmataceae bacterium]